MHRSVLLALLSIAMLVALRTLGVSPRSAAATIPPRTLTPSATQAPRAAYLPLILRDDPTLSPLPPNRTPTVPPPIPTQTTTPTSTPTTTPTSTPTTTPTSTPTSTPQLISTRDLSGTVFIRPHYRIIVDGACQDVVEDWINRIDPDHAADDIPPPFTVVYPTVGYLRLYDEHGNSLPDRGTIRIYHDAQLDHLRYIVKDLVPGTYIAEAYIAYKGTDSVSRVYRFLFDSAQGQTYQQLTFTVAPASVPGQPALLDLYLVLGGSVCPEP